MPIQNHGNDLISLNASEHYVQHWTVKEALRQLYANWMDASRTKYPDAIILRCTQTQNKITFHPQKQNKQIIQGNWIQYNRVDKTLILHNQMSFQPQRMLFGASNRRQNPVAIGQFGEGMKLAMIILLRNQIEITFESGEFVYYTTLRNWELPYDQGKVLYIQYRQRQVPQNLRDTTTVKILNIDQTLFKDFRYVSLALLKSNSYQIIQKGQSSLIFPKDPLLKAQIRKDGLLVRAYNCSLDANFQHYSYNLDIKLNRQRSAQVDVQQLKKKQSKLHFDIASDYDQLKKNMPALREALDRHFQVIYLYLNKNQNQTWYFHTHSQGNKPLCNKFYNKFKQVFNKTEVYPVANVGQIVNITNKLKLYGLEQSFYPYISVSWELYHTLIHSNYYKTIDAKITQLLSNNQQLDLTQQQYVIMQQLKNQFMPLLPQISEYQFKKKNVDNIACFKKPGNQKVIYINQFYLRNEKQKLIYSLWEALKA